MQYTVILVILLVKMLLATTLYQYQSKPSCEVTKNLTRSCLNEEITLLHSAAAAIHGNMDNFCDPLVSEQTCQLCRRFNRTKACLDMLLESCDYSDIYQFIWSQKVPYLGTVASLCKQDNVLNEIYENRECYNGITVNLRKCFNALKNRTCKEMTRGFKCSTTISKAYCAVLFNDKAHHKQLSSLYLRTLEPIIDLQNCTSDSELFIAEIYPEYQNKWRRPTTHSLMIELEVLTGRPSAAAGLVDTTYNVSTHLTLAPTMLLFASVIYILTVPQSDLGLAYGRL